MDIPTAPTAGRRTADLGDRLIVYFRPRRSWGGAAFLTIWLLGWTVGGILAAVAFGRASLPERLFLVLWLCGWVVSEGFVLIAIAWQLRGREVLIVTTDALEWRQSVGRLMRTRRYATASVRDVRAATVPAGEDERPRKDFCLRVSYGSRDVAVGEGLDAREAEDAASAVLERVRPRTWWDAEEPRASPSEAEVEDTFAEFRRRGIRIATVLLPVIALIVLLLPRTEQHATAPAAPTAAPTPAFDPRPTVAQFSIPRDYAAAMTSWALRQSRASVYGSPSCSAGGTWTSWECRVRAKAAWGPFAGRTLVYRCASGASGGILCGPAARRYALGDGEG